MVISVKSIDTCLSQELHAHLNGSISSATIEKLIARKPHLNIGHSMTAIQSGQRRTLEECVGYNMITTALGRNPGCGLTIIIYS